MEKMALTFAKRMQIMTKLGSSLLIAVLVLPISGCFQLPKVGNLTGQVAIDGSSTVYPITEAVAEEYRLQQSEVKVTVGLSGTGGGFKKFSRGEIDINDASKRIQPNQDSACRANGIGYVELEVAYDGLVVAVNPENTWCKDLKVSELKKLWEPEAQNKIMRWNQIRPEWPNEEIHLFGAGVESGTYDYFTEVIVGTSHASRGDYTGSEDDNVLVQGLAMDKYALAFFGLAYYEANREMMRLVGIDDGNPANGAGPILPTVKTVADKTYAPLGRPLYIYVNNKAILRPEVADFAKFYLDVAPELVREVGYVPLTPAEYVRERKKLAMFLVEHGVDTAAKPKNASQEELDGE